MTGIRPLALLTYALEHAPDKVRFMDFRPLIRQVKLRKRNVASPNGFRAQSVELDSVLAAVPPSLAKTLRDDDGDIVLLVRVDRDVFERAVGGIVIPPGVDV